MTWRATSVSASHDMDQHVRPSGGILQARALSKVSCLPSSLRCPQGRGRSPNAASRRSSMKHLRVRSTVAVLMWSAGAMASSDRPVSAWSHRYARVRRWAATGPPWVRASHCARSSSVRVTIDCLAMALAGFCCRRQEKSPHIKIAAVNYWA
jgi:hypothetical protein